MSNHSKLRIKFQKTGSIRYIGHLDVMRFFQKVIRRAQIDVAFTGGFSPHQIMTFASPLSVGLESMGEYMDIEVCSYTNSEDMLERMNRASIPGIRILSVKLLPENAGNAMASVAAASYRVCFREDRIPEFFTRSAEEIRDGINRLMEQSEIPYTKTGKKGTRDINLREGIFEFRLEEDGSLYLLVDASSAGNIKPSQILTAFLAGFDQSLPENALLITRIDSYTNAGTPDEPRLVSMNDIGVCF